MTVAEQRATSLRLRTAAWYGDQPLDLAVPAGWQVTAWWPRTPAPMADEDIMAVLERPAGQPAIRQLAAGRRRPVIVVDDPTRPTPAARVLPGVLRQLAEGGVPAEAVAVVVATGAHGPPSSHALREKLGEAGDRCRVVVHDDAHDLVNVGRTTRGTRVLVNRQVAASDLVIGIGGIYPQHSTGFGGGSKLALGVLGRRSITALHYGHPSMQGSYDIANEFRRDLDEIAFMIGLRTSVSLQLDADRQVVRAWAGDHGAYYEEAVAFARERYAAPPPGGADVVVSNAYPMDLSLTFMRSKGILPLLHAGLAASRVVISACPEAIGRHGLYPFINGHRWQRELDLARKVRAHPAVMARKLSARATAAVRRRDGRPTEAGAGRHPIWLYAPGNAGGLPETIPGMRALRDWDQVLEQVRQEQHGRSDLACTVYPCAPLQVLGAT